MLQIFCRGPYIVAHEQDGKRYWYFEDSEQDMIDFLENLPESAEPPRLGGMPMWCCHGQMLQEDYSKVFEEYAKYLRFLLTVKRKHGLTFPYAPCKADETE